MRRFLVLALAAILILAMTVSFASAAKPLPKIQFLSGDSQIAKLYAQGIQEMIRKNLGIEMEIVAVDFKTRLSKMRNGDFQIVFAGWGADYDDPMTFADLWITGSAFNDCKWSNKNYDALIKAAKNSNDQNLRMKAMARAEKILLDEMPIAPIYWPPRNYIEKPYVKGIVRRATGADIEWKWAYTEGRPGGDKPQYLNLNLGEEPPDLDPQTSTDQISFEVLGAVLEGLVRKNPEHKIEKGSGLALDWTVSKDATVYTFKLRDAKWSDGKPITAYDFEYAWKRAIDPRTASQYAYQFYIIKNAESVNMMDPGKVGDKGIEKALDTVGIKALDAKTLKVTLERPTPYFLDLCGFISFLPVPKHAIDKWGDKYAADADKMVFSGPFYIDEWKHESKMVLKKNPNYWDAKNVKLDQINFDMFKDINTPINMFEAGQLDAIGVPGSHIPMFKDRGMKTIADGVSWYLEFNCQDPIFKNANMRKAFAYAIDRKLFVDQVLKNGSLPATAYTPPVIHDHNGASFQEKWVGEVLPERANIAKAKKFLEAGLKELGYTLK
ncbi:MAG TPA: hypothetical protein GX509_08670 [Firmicutes bacterium]|nr:hypothetical protein [Bacillota bacterium]